MRTRKAAYNAAMLVSRSASRCSSIARCTSCLSASTSPAGTCSRDQPDRRRSGAGGFWLRHRTHRLQPDERRRCELAPLICFEDTIGELTRQFVLGGANLLANVTNDGWFLRSAGSQQHLANAVFRCVETRLPMVRAANTGVTCFVNEFGRITQILLDENGSQFTEGVLSGEVAVPVAYNHVLRATWRALRAVCAAVTTATLMWLLLRFLRGRTTVRQN